MNSNFYNTRILSVIDTYCGGGEIRSLLWIFCFVITHKISHALDPHSSPRTIVRLRVDSVRISLLLQNKSPNVFTLGSLFGCGGGEIRTHGAVSHTTVFKTVAFNHSATPPYISNGGRFRDTKPPFAYNIQFSRTGR